MNYIVKYKLKNQLFFRKLKDVKGDFIAKDLNNIRVIILNDETRLEIPLDDTCFIFSKERFINIKQTMEKETGQKVNV